MSVEKHIEEMAQDIWDSLPDYEHNFRDCRDAAERMLAIGYRKQSEGEWIYQEYSMGHYVGKCNICECEADMTNYCPNCGARMTGGAK